MGARGKRTVDSQEWVPEVPDQIGIYHSFVRGEPQLYSFTVRKRLNPSSLNPSILSIFIFCLIRAAQDLNVIFFYSCKEQWVAQHIWLVAESAQVVDTNVETFLG